MSRRNLPALVLLILALASLVAFHFLPVLHGDSSHSEGWTIWQSMWKTFQHPADTSPRTMIAFTSMVLSTLIILVSPLIVRPLSRSKKMRWLAMGLSFTSAAGITGIVLSAHLEQTLFSSFGAGFFCLVAAQLMNLAGLRLIRRA